ncbi:protein fem-1 homolog C-like [Haliotis cracherodii]|uniref:protein fem-1 homolog C-like n=1 Tax=Haliotis rufescens TaxID=6454 RepID=UPI001EB011DB|nr:protein fem-1 homolog C-like [Haliotis rufescens]
MTSKTNLEDVDVSWYASIIHNCIQEDKLSKLRGTLKKFSKEQRKRVITYKINGNAPLFMACLQGKVHIGNYLLDECMADVEQKGVYEVEEDRSRHQVTPLWCAAVANRLEVVKTLVQHGAHINSTSDTDSTPVRSACYMTNISVVKYLVDHGADIHKPNINGGTCLINSVQSSELCLFLIKKGADVNARDNSGNLALHYAIREGRLETVELLLKHGSDYRARNDFCDDSLQTAALRGYGNIVDFIIENTVQDLVSMIHAYELLGANYVDEKHDIAGGLGMWKKAMALRIGDPRNIVLKVLPTDSQIAYDNAREPQSFEELEEKVIDPDSVYMQALLIRERILGPNHKDTTFGLMYRGAVYADTHRYQRCVDLWKYAFQLRHKKVEALNHECLFTVQALVKLFWEMQLELESGATDERVRFGDALEVFDLLIQHIRNGVPKMEDEPVQQTAEDFQLLMQLSLHLIHLLARLEVPPEEKLPFKRLVHELVLQDPRGTEQESLLHLAVDPKISLTSEEFYSAFPALSVVQVLIECGANVNAVDQRRNTALYNSVKFLTYTELHDEGILYCLLNHGAHADMCNNEGHSALDLLKSHGYPICPMEYLSLKCFAARVIKKHGIPYEAEVPVTLLPFIAIHG